MSTKRKTVVRFNQWYNPVMSERFEREPDIELKTVDRDGPEENVWPDLSRAHAFQVSSAKDELPRRWFVTAELLGRCPKLLVFLPMAPAMTRSTSRLARRPACSW